MERELILSNNLPDGPYVMLDGEAVVHKRDGEVVSRSDDAGQPDRATIINNFTF